jgi:rhomboid protease GluP
MLGGEWWRLVSAMFLHGGVEHLLLNMLSLYIVGRIAERFFSPAIYLAIYLAAGGLGFLLSLTVHPASVSVGASGAIFGLFGAVGGGMFFHRYRLGERYRLFMKEYGVILALNLLLGVTLPSIDLSAHLGGLVMGLAGGYLALRSPGAFWLFLGVSTVVALVFVLKWLLPRSVILFLPLQ